MIFAIRPEPGMQATLQTGRKMGIAIAGMPLFEVSPLPWDVPDQAGFDALLLGSANAIRHGGPGLAAFRHLPAYAVGETTAQVARAAGFNLATAGSGGLQSLLDTLDSGLRFLRLAGTEHVPLDLADEISVTTIVVYDVHALSLRDADIAALRAAEPLVLLHSAAAARHFAAECERCELDKARIALACIGMRVAAAAGHGWRDCHCAPNPDDTTLLALARDMCH